MKTTPVLSLLLAVSTVAFSSTSASQAQTAHFPNNTTINYSIPYDARVGFASQEEFNLDINRTSPTINIVEGANIGHLPPYSTSLSVYNRSIVNISGGILDGNVIANNMSTIFVSGGTMYTLTPTDSSVVFVSGGVLSGQLAPQGESISHVSGGTIIDGIYPKENAIVNISGGSALNVQAYNNTVINITGGIARNLYYAFHNGKIKFCGFNLSATLIDPNAFGGFKEFELSGTLADGTNLAGKRLYVQNGSTASFTLCTADARVSGTITLQEVVNAAQPISFTFRPTTGSEFSRTVTLDAAGGFTLADVPQGDYIVSIKGEKWLRKNITVNTTTGNVTNANATLRTGDANNDNFADIADLLILISAYNRVSPNVGYSASADFNCDDRNDIDDLLLLISNYNSNGEL